MHRHQGETSSFRPQYETLPVAAVADRAASLSFCESVTPIDESPYTWTDVLHELVAQPDFAATRITEWFNTMDNFKNRQRSDPHLGRLLTAADDFLENIAANCVRIAPASIRSAVHHFAVQYAEQPEGPRVCIFNARKSHREVRNLLRLLLTHLYANRRDLLDKPLKFLENHPGDEEQARDFQRSAAGVVPSILVDIASEEGAPGNLTILHEFALLNCFTSRAGGLKLKPFASASSMFAALVYLVKLTSVAKSVLIQSDAQNPNRKADAMEVVVKVRDGDFLNHICPKLNWLKRASSDKPKIQRSKVDDRGNISVDGVKYKRSRWERLIPLWRGMVEELLGKIFIGEGKPCELA